MTIRKNKKKQKPIIPLVPSGAGFWERWIRGARVLYAGYPHVGSILAMCWFVLIPYAYIIYCEDCKYGVES